MPKVSEVRIRNVDAAALARIDQLAKAAKKSRNRYLKEIIENVAVSGDLRDQEDRYTSLMNLIVEYIQQGTFEQQNTQMMLERILQHVENSPHLSDDGLRPDLSE